ncbi:hypothetical protein AMECASPLE_027160 [Ameca splendens]|uniref:Uncharacterized protein n=1 Tax=Ameca splendens TaxID=208324 RepID=A0ABV0YGV6_9TELE
MIKPVYVVWIPFCLRLDSHQAGSFLLSSSPEPSHKRTLSTLQCKPPHIELVPLSRAHTEQHQVNSLRISLLKDLDPESHSPWRPDHHYS